MADPGLQTLLSSKAALDLGLISQADFDAVKNAFLRAQQIKAAVDVGLIKGEDYESAKREYLGSLIGSSASGGAPASNGGAPSAAAAPAPAPARPAPAPARPAPAQQQPHAPQPAAAPAPPPPAVARPAAVAPAAAAAAPAATLAPQAVEARRTASSGIVPANIPKVGGIKAKPTTGTSMSGISVSEDAVNLYYLMRAKSTYRWALWQVDDAGTSVVIAAVGEKDSTYGDFIAALPEGDCRYGVFDYQYTAPDGQVLNKLVFLNWAPDAARVKSKMMYASTKDYFKGHLDGLSAEFQASELDEVTEEEVGAAVRALKRS